MIWTNNTFSGHYPVGSAAVVSAKTAEEAAERLNNHLALIGLPQQEPVTPEQMVKFSQTDGNLVVLWDGNY